MDINDLRNKRGKAVKQMRDINDKVMAEGRDFNDDEQSQYDSWDKEQDSLKNQIARAERQEQIESEGLQLQNQNNGNGAPTGLGIDNDDEPQRPVATKAYKNAFRKWCQVGSNNIGPKISNALEVGTNSEGGFIVPEEYETKLVVSLENINVMRQLASVITTASDRNIPVEATRGDAAWTAEEGTYSEDDPVFAQKVLSNHKLGRIVKVSEELLQDSFFDLPSYMADNFARSFGVAEEAAFVNGDGSGKPTGVVGGSEAGVTAAGAAAITSDEMIDLYYSLKRIYRSNATFIAADATIKLLRKLKDGDAQYLWQPGLVSGEPDRMLGQAIVSSDGMPAATTGLKSVVFGDMSYYWIGDRVGRQMQRLNELYAATGQVGFKMHQRVDGVLTLNEAVKHLVQA